MKRSFERLNKRIINAVLIIAVFVFLSGVWDWISKNSTVRGEILTIASLLVVILMLVLRIIHIPKVKKTLKGQLG